MERVIVGGPKYDPPENHWFYLEGDEMARSLFATARSIEYRQSSIASGNRRHAELYASYTPVGLSWAGPGGYNRPSVQTTRNVVRSVCDTATALISKSLPRPRVLTVGARWEVQQRAKLLDKFLVGAYSMGKIYHAAQAAFRDATIFGTGVYVLRTTAQPSFRVVAERMLVDDLIVDEEQCTDGQDPEDYILRRVLPVRQVVEKYAKDDEEMADRIMANAGKSVIAWPAERVIPADRVVVLEAWHIPSDGSPGIHTTCLDDLELKTKAWNFPWWPGVVLHWSPPLSGFYGDGVAYRQYGRQKRINYLYKWVQRCQDLIAVPRVWVDATNGPLKVQVSNEIGEIVGVRGQPPVFQTPQAVGQEIYKWLDQLESGGFEDEGISQMSASNQLPPGLESAPAQREYSFKEGQRFAPVSQRWENAVAKETAHKLIALFKDGAPDGTSVKWSSRKVSEQIDWEEVDMEQDEYEIRVEASSLETLSPAGRLQAAIELSQTGWLKPDEGRRLLGHPDLERSDEKALANTEYAEWLSCELINGRFHPPNEYGDIQLQQETVMADIQNAEMSGAPAKIIAGMRQFLHMCDAKLNPAQPPPGLAGLDPNAPPMGMPPGIAGAPAPAMSLASAQGLTPMGGGGVSHQNM